MKEVYEFLKRCGTFYVATAEGNQPRVRPFGALDWFEDRIYTQTGRIKKVFAQLMSNPKVEICGMAGGEWIRIEAIAVRDERREAKQHLLDANPMLKSMYSADDDNTEVFYFRDATATISSFTAEPKVIRF